MTEKQLSPEAKRKQEQRAKDKANGLNPVTIKLHNDQKAKLTKNREFRGDWPESEYIQVLLARYLPIIIDMDDEKAEQQRQEMGECKMCGLELPKGCEDKNKGAGECFRTFEKLKLNL